MSVISPEPPAPIGPPRSAYDAMLDAWNAGTGEDQNRFLKDIGCKFVTRTVTVVECCLDQLERNVGG